MLYKLRGNLLTPSDRQTKDVPGILQVLRDMIDHEYLSHWIAVIGVGETLEELTKETQEKGFPKTEISDSSPITVYLKPNTRGSHFRFAETTYSRT